MIRREATTLGILRNRDPQPSIEIRPDTLESSGRSFDEVAQAALKRLAASKPELKATVYVYGSMSVNFHEPAWSEFLIPVGPHKDAELVLRSLDAAFRSCGAQCRLSDYVRPSEGRQVFHLEDAQVWRPEDAITWYSATTELAEEPPGSDASSEPARAEDDDWEWNIGDEGEKHTGPSRRNRRVRADAFVGSVRSQIERAFGLPEGSVSLCGPDGRPLRADALIRTLRTRWEE